MFINEIKENHKYKKLRNILNVTINLGCLGLGQVLKGTIVAAFPNLLPIFFTVQFFGSTLQGSLSDIYRRSIVLNIALCIIITFTFSLVSTNGHESPFVKTFQLICAIFIGLGGNADVVGRASIIDIHYHMDRRKVLSWTVFAEAFSWIIVGFLIRFLSLEPFSILNICIVIASILLILSFLFNFDVTSDKKHIRNTFNELKILTKKHLKKMLSISFIVITGELGYFFFFYAEENNITDKLILADTYLSWFIGMSLGCLVPMKIKQFKDSFYIILGLSLSFIATIIFIIQGMKSITDPNMFFFDSSVFGIAGFGSGIFLPCFYSMISRGYSIHFQGILTGWIDSIRVFGDALSNIALLTLIIFPFSIPIFISSLLFLLSLFLIIINRRKIE